MKELGNFIENLIREGVNDFTPVEKRIADYFLTKYQDLPFITIQELAKELNVGRASILRFSRKLGFDGYHDLRNEIKLKLHDSLAPLENFRTKLESKNGKDKLIHEIAQNEFQNIDILLNNYKEKDISKAVKLISESDFVFTIGSDLSTYLAGITNYLLQRIGVKSGIANIGGRTLVDQIFNISENDLLIAFSFPPYSQPTIDAAAHAKKRGTKVLAITNTITSPINNYSDLVLQLNTQSSIFTNSISAVLVLVYTLVYKVAFINKTRSKEAIDERLVKKM